MEILFTILIMVSVVAFGFFVVDLIGSPLDEGSRGRYHRAHGPGQSRRTRRPGRDFR